MCRLMQSSISDKLIIFSACEGHEEYEEEMDTTEPDASINQVHADTEAQQDLQLASIIELLAIADFEEISMEDKSYCLYDGVYILVSQTFISQNSYTKDYPTQISLSDSNSPPESFEPLSPDIGSSTQTMQVISNLL